MTDEQFQQFIAVLREEIGLAREDAADGFKAMRDELRGEMRSVGAGMTIRMDALSQELAEGFRDVQARIDNVNRTLIDHGQRLTSIEKAIVHILPTLKLVS